MGTFVYSVPKWPIDMVDNLLKRFSFTLREMSKFNQIRVFRRGKNECASYTYLQKTSIYNIISDQAVMTSIVSTECSTAESSELHNL